MGFIYSFDADPQNDSIRGIKQTSLYSKTRVYSKLHWQQKKTKQNKNANWLKGRLVTKTD